jgi:hypothetical protein
LTIESEVRRMASEAIGIAADLGIELDEEFGEENVALLHDAVLRMRAVDPPPSEKGRTLTIQRFGCYFLQIAATSFDGKLLWSQRFDQPVFEWSDGERCVTMLGWRKIEGLLGGDDGDQLMFHWDGVAEAIRRGTRKNVVFV